MKHILIVDEAINGIEALEKSLNKHYDLYLVDVNMPLLDGYSFVRALRRLADITQAGANLYIIKPTRPDVRINNIRRLLGESGVCPPCCSNLFLKPKISCKASMKSDAT